MTVRRNRLLLITAAVVLFLAVAVFVFSDPILRSLGAILVTSEVPRKADLIVVIGGDFKGNRIVKGAELVRQGYAPRVLSSGSGDLYGHFECDLAIGYAVSHGYSEDSFIGLRYPALNTRDEARAVIARMRQLGVHRYLLVTSDYHTGRATRIFRHEAADLEEHTVAAPDPDWNGGQWWKNREGRKLWFYEMIKTVTGRFGI
jgi:uncharacterized SAM-binding protein YcdF (DUF218 family)